MQGWQFEKSYYEASATRPPLQAALAGEEHADVCVVGGGFCGLSCALELAQQGRSVVVVEANAVGWGASGRSGGQIIDGFAAHNLPAVARAAKVSEKTLFDMSLEAVELINQRVAKHGIDCDLRRGYAEAAVKPAHLRELHEWVEKAAREYDYPHNTVLDRERFREEVTSRAYCGGMINDISGHLHPLKYVLGLAAAAQEAGAHLFENSAATRVQQIDGGAGGAIVHTAGGQVKCGSVLIACNAYLDGDLLPQAAGNIMPVGTYIGATPPLGEAGAALIPNNRGVCNTNFVLDYYRLSADKRLLFGGRVSYSRIAPLSIRNSIRARMLSVFPQLHDTEFEFLWGGYVAITINRFPDLGRVGSAVYYAQGFSGHGVALSGYAGKLIAQAMMGDAEKFDIFHRFEHRSFPGGRVLRMPLLVLAMLYYRLRDLL